MNLMLSLYPACHAKVHRTKAALKAMGLTSGRSGGSSIMRVHEQVQLDFTSTKPVAKLVPLFKEEGNRAGR